VGKLEELIYRRLRAAEMNLSLFENFERRQIVTRCRRKVDGIWMIVEDPFVDQWDDDDYHTLVFCLRRTLDQGGVVFGAFLNEVLKGFASVEGMPLGSRGQYRDLSSLHVSEEQRRKGIGRALFLACAAWAREQGAEKLYLSTHSAVETQAFYHAVGCVEALEYNEGHVRKEPCDCQLEYLL
jgi:GNAT superfamily N-acetyltransferase